MLTIETMRQLWPNGNAKIPGLLEGIVASAPTVLPKYGLDSPLVLAHFMAQVSHECGAGEEVEENLNYRAAQLLSQWPSHFTRAQAMAMQHKPREIANQAYNGRMKNRPGTDDGWNYRGRGATQTTGYEGYDDLGRHMGLDLLGRPDLVNEPSRFLECGAADFIICGCLPFAQRDDVRGVTHHLNGGLIGLDQREHWLARWKAVLAAAHPDAPMELPRADGVLRYGDSGFEIEAVERKLASLGYAVGTIDEKFGPAVRAAVLAFQADNALPTTGEVDQATRAALETAPPKPISEARSNATADDLRQSGSQTVAAGDKLATAGKVIVGAAGTSAAADQTGALDKAREAVDQVSAMRGVIDSAQGLIHWMGSHWPIWVIVVGGLIWYFGRDVIKQRLADHRSGANMGR